MFIIHLLIMPILQIKTQKIGEAKQPSQGYYTTFFGISVLTHNSKMYLKKIKFESNILKTPKALLLKKSENHCFADPTSEPVSSIYRRIHFCSV